MFSGFQKKKKQKTLPGCLKRSLSMILHMQPSFWRTNCESGMLSMNFERRTLKRRRKRRNEAAVTITMQIHLTSCDYSRWELMRSPQRTDFTVPRIRVTPLLWSKHNQLRWDRQLPFPVAQNPLESYLSSTGSNTVWMSLMMLGRYFNIAPCNNNNKKKHQTGAWGVFLFSSKTNSAFPRFTESANREFSSYCCQLHNFSITAIIAWGSFSWITEFFMQQSKTDRK